MAQVSSEKFKVLQQTQSKQTTHADLQKKKPGRPANSKVKKEQANVSLSVALTPTQKQQLIEYAEKDDRSAGYIIKKLLIEHGIIEPNKKIKDSK